MRFADPYWLVFLIAAPWPWVVYRRRRRVAWPTLDGFDPPRRSWPRRLAVGAVLARSLALVAIVLGLARPQTAGEEVQVQGRGIGIGLILDRSSSMRTADFPREGGPPLSRLDAARATLAEFLDGRTDDLIGAVAFANLPDTIAPPTLDRQVVWDALRAVRPAGAGDDGTDLGAAIAWGLGLVRPLPTRRQILILLTDGHHAPSVPGRSLDPLVAAEVARGLGISLYTVAIGRPDQPPPPEPTRSDRPPSPVGKAAPLPQPQPQPSPPLDEGPDRELLAKLAERGGGRAFAATDQTALGDIFRSIDALETAPVEGTIRTVYRERFGPFVLGALGLVVLDFALRSGRLRRRP